MSEPKVSTVCCPPLTVIDSLLTLTDETLQDRRLQGFAFAFVPQPYRNGIFLSSDGINKFLHPVGAVLPHFVGHMAVHIQGKSCGGVSQIALHRFDVVPGFDRGHSVCVPLRYNNDKPEKSRIFKGFQGFKPDF